MTDASGKIVARGGWVRRLFWALRPLAYVVNPVVLRFAGRRALPLTAVLEHRGRRSGRAYRTPFYVRRVGDAFIVPLFLGERADWCRNLRAAGSATLIWRGHRYAVAEPAVIAIAKAPEAFAAPIRRMLSLLAIDSCIRVRAVGAL